MECSRKTKKKKKNINTLRAVSGLYSFKMAVSHTRGSQTNYQGTKEDNSSLKTLGQITPYIIHVYIMIMLQGGPSDETGKTEVP
jgi:hypothetical protein